MRALDGVLAELEEATSWLLHDVRQLSEAAWTQPSLLPGWTRAHVVTHLAQNADGGVRLLTWARTRVPSFEYESVAARAVAIGEGFRRPAEAQVQHLQASAVAFRRACEAMTANAWQNCVTWTTGQQTPAHVVARSRLTEVLVHHVDLAVGLQPAAWPAWFVTERLHRVVEALNRQHAVPETIRLETTDLSIALEIIGTSTELLTIKGTEVQILAWLLGRSQGVDLWVSSGAAPPQLPSTYST